ncbi:MAG: SOS response-associated peptidase [Gammaproteobacteria bacterium]
MCGRFALTEGMPELSKIFGLKKELLLKKRYNISPGTYIPVIDLKKNIDLYLWGLDTFINLRLETILDNPHWKKKFIKNRCLIPANAFYEWKVQNRGKQPYAMVLPKKGVFAMVGLFLEDQYPDKNQAKKVVIITRSALNQGDTLAVSSIHHRMPLILKDLSYSIWFGSKNILKEKELLTENLYLDAGHLMSYPVPSAMNQVKFDNEACLMSLH